MIAETGVVDRAPQRKEWSLGALDAHRGQARSSAAASQQDN
jgi:hypothetical protein